MFDSRLPEPLEKVCQELRQNRRTELRLLGRDSDIELNRRNLAALERAMQQNYRVRSVFVGWRHKESQKEHLIYLLLLLEHLNLTSIELVLDTWIPGAVILKVLSSQPYLESLQLRATTTKKRHKFEKGSSSSTWSSPSTSIRSTSTSIRSTSSSSTTSSFLGKKWKYSKDGLTQSFDFSCINADENSSIAELLLPQLKRHNYLDTLAFDNCDVTDETAKAISLFIRQKDGIDELSLRGNRSLGPQGAQDICQAAVRKKLDLSLCDFQDLHAISMARGLEQRRMRNPHDLLKELVLCGNYEIGGQSMLLLVQMATPIVEHLNLSYCDIEDHQLVDILRHLQEEQPKRTGLKQLTMQGSRIANDEASALLGKLISYNESIHTLRFDNPAGPFNLKLENYQHLVDGIRNNYILEECVFDCFPRANEEEMKLRDELDFYLRLNRAGRRILREDVNWRVQSWIEVLINVHACPRHDILYWFVRNSVFQLLGTYHC